MHSHHLNSLLKNWKLGRYVGAKIDENNAAVTERKNPGFSSLKLDIPLTSLHRIFVEKGDSWNLWYSVNSRTLAGRSFMGKVFEPCYLSKNKLANEILWSDTLRLLPLQPLEREYRRQQPSVDWKPQRCNSWGSNFAKRLSKISRTKIWSWSWWSFRLCYFSLLTANLSFYGVINIRSFISNNRNQHNTPYWKTLYILWHSVQLTVYNNVINNAVNNIIGLFGLLSLFTWIVLSEFSKRKSWQNPRTSEEHS